jgi:hypothetical protein
MRSFLAPLIRPLLIIRLQSQLRAKTVVDYRVDVATIARRMRAGLRAATREQQQELLRSIIRRITYQAREVEIEFSIPVSGAQTCKREQHHVDSLHPAARDYILLKVKRRVA